MVFCDSGCGGKALTKLGAAVVKKAAKQTSSNAKHLKEINSVSNSTIQLGTDVTTGWIDANQAVLSALDARTNRIELAQIQNQKTKSRLTDHKLSTLVNTLKESLDAKNIEGNSQIIANKISQPETGNVGANSTAERRIGFEKSRKLVSEIAATRAVYKNQYQEHDQTMALQLKLTKPDEIFNPTDLVLKDTLSNDALNNLEELLSYLSFSKPLSVLPENKRASHKASQYELDRRNYNATITWIETIVDKNLARKAQFIDPSWAQSYVHRSSTESNMSFNESIAALIDGRVTADGWYLNLSTMTTIGLQRELTYLKAEENLLHFLSIEQAEMRNQLLALKALGLTKRSIHKLKSVRTL